MSNSISALKWKNLNREANKLKFNKKSIKDIFLWI